MLNLLHTIMLQMRPAPCTSGMWTSDQNQTKLNMSKSLIHTLFLVLGVTSYLEYNVVDGKDVFVSREKVRVVEHPQELLGRHALPVDRLQHDFLTGLPVFSQVNTRKPSLKKEYWRKSCL